MKRSIQAELFKSLPRYPRSVIREVVIKFLGLIRSKLLDEGFFRLDEIGLLCLRRWHARRCRNFKTGELYSVPSRLMLSVRATKKMKLAIGERKEDEDGKE